MSFRQIVIRAPEGVASLLVTKAEESGAIDIAVIPEAANGRVQVRLLAGQDHRQAVLDAVQSVLAQGGDWRMTILPVETTIPFPESEEEAETAAREAEGRGRIGGRTREEIYDGVWAQARLDRTFLSFVALSTVVAAFGMVTDNVAVIIGAMVIAPLLGPNLAFAVGVALGDAGLMGRAALTNAVGIGLALGLGLATGLVWPVDDPSAELLARADVGFDGIAIALASGAAAALSLVSGISSTLVGVMVAVALLPPTTAIGLFLGAGQTAHALGATLLLAVNLVCVNLSAQAVMLVRGVTPRTFFEKRRARIASLVNAVVAGALLAALVALLVLRTPSPPA